MSNVLEDNLVVVDGYPGLRFTPDGHAHYLKVVSDLTPDHLVELQKQLTYLSGYGGDRFQVHLHPEMFSKWSFSLAWMRPDKTTGEWHYAWNGGLVYHCAGEPFASVSLTPQVWGVHT